MSTIKRQVRRAFGWIRLRETANKVLLAGTVPALRRAENAQVRRLRATLPERAQRPLVVTVIPTYRRPEGLRRAVVSALAQTVTDHLVMVVDDGAGLAELPEDPRLIAVSLDKNLGVAGVVRNVGIRLTDSRFVAFLDDDNTWTPDHLEAALSRLQPPAAQPVAAPAAQAAAAQPGPGAPAPAADGVYTALRRLTPDGEVRDVLSVPFDRKQAADRCFVDINAFVARRTRTLRFSRLRRKIDVVPKEDWELIFRYSRRHRVEHVPVTTVDYLINPDSYWTAWESTGS